MVIFKQKFGICRQNLYLFFFCSMLVCFSSTLNLKAQDSPKDSALFIQQVQDLIQQQQFASAHLLLQERLQQNGMKPSWVCWMVKNGLNNFYRHEKYEHFYLKDVQNFKTKAFFDTIKNVRTTRLRHPDRMLKQIFQQNPNHGWAHKLMGNYFELQLNDLKQLPVEENKSYTNLEKQVFSHYSQAIQSGYKDPYLNRWVGDYYMQNNQIELAQKHYLKNVENEFHDPLSFYRLAEISYEKKHYTQAYNYIVKALQYFPPDDVYLKYDAVRLGGKALKALGDINKFIQYMNECIQVLPNLQAAYIDLFKFYNEREQTEQALKTLEQMLLNNPYDIKGYRVVEGFIVEEENFYFADSLFEELQMKYENWEEVLANIYWSKGNLAYYQGYTSEAKKLWEISRNYMLQYLPENSQLLNRIGEIAHNNNHK